VAIISASPLIQIDPIARDGAGFARIGHPDILNDAMGSGGDNSEGDKAMIRAGVGEQRADSLENAHDETGGTRGAADYR